MYQSDYPSDYPPSSTGLPWYKIWLKALIPEGQAYETIAADPGASIGKACLWVFLTNLVCTGALMLLVGLFLGLVMWSGTEAYQGGPGIIETTIVLLCIAPVVSGTIGVLGLLMTSGLSHAIATMLGGTGTFTKLTYVFGAYLAPLMIVSTVISFIPIVNYLGFIVVIYGIVLSIMAVKAVHQLDWGRAIASSAVIWVGLLCCFAFVIIFVLTLMGPSIGNVFSNIIENLATPTPAW